MDKQFTIDFAELLALLRKRFGDDALRLTFIVAWGESHSQVFTFAGDNMRYLREWLQEIYPQLQLGEIACIAMVARVFKVEKMRVEKAGGTSVELPKADIYHFLVYPNILTGFDVETALELQGTDPDTGELLPREPAVTCQSSIDLLEQLGCKVKRD